MSVQIDGWLSSAHACLAVVVERHGLHHPHLVCVAKVRFATSTSCCIWPGVTTCSCPLPVASVMAVAAAGLFLILSLVPAGASRIEDGHAIAWHGFFMNVAFT